MNIVLPTYNRLDYLKRSMSSLLASKLGEEDCVWVYDDNSTEEGVKEFLLKHESSRFKINFNEKNLGCDHNVYQSIGKTFKQTSDRFVVVTDPDAIYNDSWLSFIKKKLEERGGSREKIGLLGVFNTSNHPEVQKDDLTQQFGIYKDPTLCQKKSIGGLAVAINRDIFKRIRPEVVLNFQSHFCWDWQAVTLCREMNYHILCSRDSYVDHIGHVGVHSPNEEFWRRHGDKVINFLGASETQSFEDFIL